MSTTEKVSKTDKLAFAVQAADSLINCMWNAISTTDMKVRERYVDLLPELQQNWQKQNKEIEQIMHHYSIRKG